MYMYCLSQIMWNTSHISMRVYKQIDHTLSYTISIIMLNLWNSITYSHTLIIYICALLVIRCPNNARYEDTVHYFFYLFFIVRPVSVLRGHSVFSSPPQRPMTSDFEGFSIPDCIHYIYFPILILEKEPVFSLLNVQC